MGNNCNCDVFMIVFDSNKYIVQKKCIKCGELFPCNQEESEMALDMHREKVAK